MITLNTPILLLKTKKWDGTSFYGEAGFGLQRSSIAF